LSKHLGRPGGFVLGHRPPGACQPFEARCIELIEIDLERVAGWTRRQHSGGGILRPAGVENRPELRDMEPELPAGFQRIVGPEHVDDPVRRHQPVRVHQ